MTECNTGDLDFCDILFKTNYTFRLYQRIKFDPIKDDNKYP